MVTIRKRNEIFLSRLLIYFDICCIRIVSLNFVRNCQPYNRIPHFFLLLFVVCGISIFIDNDNETATSSWFNKTTLAAPNQTSQQHNQPYGLEIKRDP